MVNRISRMASGCAESAGVDVSRASSLDVLKCLAAFLVVWIHYGSCWLTTPIIRCAVPIFFVITGYYYPMMVESGRFWKHFRKLLIMAICASALYGADSLLQHMKHDTLDEWISMFSLERIVRLVVLNQPIFGFHLWYFFAALNCLIVFHLADKWRLTKWLRYAVPLLLLVHFVRNFTPLPLILVRNFLFMGLPCMMIGRCIRENRDGAFHFLANGRYSWAYTFGSLLLVCGEILLLSIACSDNGVREMYIFTLPMFLPYFYWALRHPRFGEGTLLATIGRKYSAYIYIFHVLAATYLPHFMRMGDSLFTKAIYPFIVFTVSLCMTWLFARLLKWLKSLIAYTP